MDWFHFPTYTFFSAKTNPKLLYHSSHALRGLNDTRFVETKKSVRLEIGSKKMNNVSGNAW